MTRAAQHRQQPPARDLATENSRADWLILAFAVLIFALPYEAVFPGPLRGNGSPARLLGLAMLALVVITVFAKRRFLPSGTAALAGIGCAVGYAALSLFMYARTMSDFYITSDQSASATRFVMGVLTVLGVVLFVILRTRTQYQRTAIVWAVLVGAMISVMIGLVQGVSSQNWRDALVPPGFVFVLQKGGLAERDGFTRVIGTAGHPIEFSLTVAIALPLAIHLSRFARTRNQRVVASIFTVALLLAIPASVSRTAIVAVLASLVVYAAILPIRALLAGLFVISAGVAAYAVLAPDLFDAVTNLFRNTESNNSITGRTDDYAVVGDAFRASPWIGYGPGNSFASSRFLDNQWLQAILSGGVVGIFSMVLVVLGTIFGVAYSLRQCDPDRPAERDLVYALAGGLTSMLIATTIFDEFSFSQTLLTLFLFYGLVWTFHGSSDSGDLLSHRDIRTKSPPLSARHRWSKKESHV